MLNDSDWGSFAGYDVIQVGVEYKKGKGLDICGLTVENSNNDSLKIGKSLALILV